MPDPSGVVAHDRTASGAVSEPKIFMSASAASAESAFLILDVQLNIQH
jgi:hypothetical protein